MFNLRYSITKNIWVVSAVILFIFSLLHPMTRPIMMLILPLGSGPDDLIVIAIVVVFVILWKDLGKRNG